MQNKTIMIDGLNLALDKGTGVSTYARTLSFELHKLGHRVEVLHGLDGYGGRDELLQEISYFDTFGSEGASLARKISNALAQVLDTRMREVPQTGRVISQSFQSRMPYANRIWNKRGMFVQGALRFGAFGSLSKIKPPVAPDIMHWTYPVPLTMKRAKNIYTLHDLVPLRLPYTTLDQKSYYLALLRKLVKSADHIVTVSETSRKDIIDLLNCPEDKVTNTYQAVDIPDNLSSLSVPEVKRSIEGTFGLTYKDYFLFFGSIEPKKNIGRLIEAYLSSNVQCPLVLVGARAWRSKNELKLINESSNRIHQIEYAPFPLLVNLIRGAKAVTFPSLYEGFGLPILEAMQLGTPVITSNIGATREVAAEAALLVDPYNVRDISNAIFEIDRNAEMRAKMSAAGSERANFFSRQKYREKLSQVYEKVLADN